MSHRPEIDSDVQGASSSETARWNTRHVRSLGRHDEKSDNVEI